MTCRMGAFKDVDLMQEVAPCGERIGAESGLMRRAINYFSRKHSQLQAGGSPHRIIGNFLTLYLLSIRGEYSQLRSSLLESA